MKTYTVSVMAVRGRYLIRTRDGSRWTEGVSGLRTLRGWVARLRAAGYRRVV